VSVFLSDRFVTNRPRVRSRAGVPPWGCGQDRADGCPGVTGRRSRVSRADRWLAAAWLAPSLVAGADHVHEATASPTDQERAQARRAQAGSQAGEKRLRRWVARWCVARLVVQEELIAQLEHAFDLADWLSRTA
jgi:hypothetical protein